MVGFTLNEAGVIMCGLAYNGHFETPDGSKSEPMLDRVKACYVWGIEKNFSVKDFLASWNMSI